MLIGQFVLFLIVSLKKNLIFRPVIFYGFTLFLYPIISNGLYVYDLVFLYPWHPSYNQSDYLLSIKISLASLTPISIMPFFLKKQTEKFLIKGSLDNFFIVRSIFRIVMVILFLYALSNFKQFVMVEYNDLEIFGLITLFDYLIFSILLFWQGFFPHEKFRKIDIVLLAGYFLLKLMSGGRMFLVVVALLLAINFIRKYGFKLNSLKLLLFGLPIAALVLGGVVVIRERSSTKIN